MSTDKPVVFLAFANEYEAGRRLDNVVKEREQLESILNEAYRNGLCDKPIVRQNVSIKTFLDILGSEEWADRIAIIHYGGHADGYQLLLEGMEGKRQVAKGDGLVNIMARRENQENLKLVFLNGCSTEKLAKAMTDRGVPIVIGTSTAIKDDEALTVATRFYTGLANGLTMAGAWADAKNEVESVKAAEETVKDSDHTRGIELAGDITGRFPWEESFKDSASEVVFKKWNLPEESKNPLFNLPPLPKAQLPASPFLFLKPYEARHAEIFFGRSSYIRDLWLKVVEPNAPPIILLYGESGAGKSSLLDAGLRPRLEAAKKDGKERFEVRYLRRDQDKGLVATLADMLSYSPEAETEEPAQAEETEADPNLDKILRIEAIAGELEEETANTFRSIIDRYKAIRAYKPVKQAGLGLYNKDAKGNLKLDKQAGANLRKAWVKIEKESGRELIVILDQVEEAITRPHAQLSSELEGLLGVLKDLFVRPAADKGEKIKGKIILGYREEFNAKILARSQDYELSPSTVFLEQLKEKDIEEIFRELPKLRGINYYNLTIDEGLPGRIAGDLLKGRSAVAPVLQLLLTRLWENTYNAKTNSAHFTIEAYDKTQSGGREMEKYFRDQMGQVRKWNPEVVESGLVLDILQFHVTELGTSRRRDFEKEIRPRYKHLEEEYGYRQGFVEELIKKLKSPEVFLLNDEGRGYTSLPHDTLAPIVRREYDRSEKLGQRSARILEIRKSDLNRVKNEAEELRKLRLNSNDLDVVSEGKKGMRSLNERERALLRISMEEREKRLRQRRVWTKAGIVSGLFILALSILAGSLSVSVNEQLQEQVIAKALDASLIEQDKNPDWPSTKAIQLAQFAYSESSTKRVDVVNNLYSLYEKSRFVDGDEVEAPPQSIALKPGAKIDALDFCAPFGPFLVQYQDSMVKYWPDRGKEETISLRKTPDEFLKLDVGFSADGNMAQAISYFDRIPLYIADGELVEAPWMPVYSSQNENGEYYLGYYDFFAGRLVDGYGRSYTEGEFKEEYAYLLSINDNGEYFVNVNASDVDTSFSFIPISVDTLFSFKLMNEKSRLLNSKLYNEGKDRGWWYAVRGQLDYLGTNVDLPLRKTHLAQGQYHDIRVWNTNKPDEGPDSMAIQRVLLFFQAISDGRYLAVNPARELFILDAGGEQIDGSVLLPSETGLLDLAISPARRNVFAMTRDSAYIWDLSGNLVAAYPHSNIRDFSFSDDGYRLLTVSSDTVKIVQWAPAQQKPAFFSYSPPPDTTLPEPTRIVLARFHENDAYLVIGLEDKVAPPRMGGFFNWLKSLLSPNKKGKDQQPIRARIVYRDFQRGQEQIFEAPSGPLNDATVSQNGQYAVALQSGKATVIPIKKGLLPSDSLNTQTIEGANIENYLTQESSRISISPGGKYIIRQSPRRIELFIPSGKRVNTYSFQNGFQPGFNGQLFTPDDQFLIGKKSDEVLFWNPEDKSIRAWAKDYELSIEDKRDFQLTTFMDDIPGAKADAKWWGLRVLLVSLIFIILYYSDFIIQAIQHKKYLEPAFYFVGFSLFSLLLLLLWAAGAYDPELRKVVFYSIVWATLALLSMGIYRFGGKHKQLPGAPISGGYLEQLKYWFSLLPKFGTLIALCIMGAFVLVGSGIFFIKETSMPEQMEWLNLLAGLFIPSVFMGLIGYPIHLVIRKYRAGAFSDFYRWLLLPTGCLIFIFWIAYSAIVDLGYGDSIAGLLSLASGLMILWAIVRQSRIYLRSRKYAAFGAFTFPVASVLFLVLINAFDTNFSAMASLFILALPMAFIMGRQHLRQGAYRRAFLLFSTSIFLAAGALSWAIISLNDAIWLGLLLVAPVLVLVFYGLRRQLNNRAARQAAGKWAWANWLAILVFWILGLFVTSVFTGAMLDSAYAFEDDYEEYPYPEEEGLSEGPMEEGLTGDTSPAPLESSQSEQSLNQEAGEGGAESSVPESAFPAKADFNAPILNQRQQLIVQLFDADEITRERARTGLETNWKNDQNLIPELIQYSYENPDKKEGVGESLKLLAIQSDQLLRSNRSQLGPYLEWVSQKSLGDSAAEQIQDLQDRAGF